MVKDTPISNKFLPKFEIIIDFSPILYHWKLKYDICETYETLLQRPFYLTFSCNGDVVATRSSAIIKLDQKGYKEKLKWKLHRISNDDVINMWFLKKKNAALITRPITFSKRLWHWCFLVNFANFLGNCFRE